MGSGKLIKRAIKKHGIENFSKEYLGIYDTEKEMNVAEKILVVIDSELSYNLCSGGQGGFGYINSERLNFDLNSLSDEKLKLSRGNGGRTKFLRYGFSESFILNGTKNNFLGKKHTEETKQKMSKNHNPNSHPVGVKRGPYKKRSENIT